MKRGEVWWAELPPPVGNRPVVILTRDKVLRVALVTRTIRQLPTEVTLGRRQGLPVRSVANLDNILTVPRHRLVRRIGACGSNKIAELNQAIKASLDIPWFVASASSRIAVPLNFSVLAHEDLRSLSWTHR